MDKNYECKVPQINDGYTINSDLLVDIKEINKIINAYELHNYTKYIHSYSSIINKYVNDNEPWNKKNNSEQNIKNILFSTLVALKNIFILLYPVMPLASIKFLKSLNINEHEIKMDKINEKLIINDQLTKPDILFNKYE